MRWAGPRHPERSPTRRTATLLGVSAISSVLVPGIGRAQVFPTRSIVLVAPFPAGSGADLAARFIAARLTEAFGQTVIVENKPGADGIVAAQSVARATPDGHTILIGTNSTHAANLALYRRLPYDPETDFTPVARILRSPLALLVRAASGIATVADLIAAARERPDGLRVGFGNTSGRGAAELFMGKTGTRFTRVSYRGTPGALTDLLGGRLDLVFADLAVTGEHVRTGELRALGVTSTSRMASFPDLPTLIEAGLDGYEIIAWVAAFVPAGTPMPVVDTLAREIDRSIVAPKARALLAAAGAEPFPAKREEFQEFLRSQTRKWREIVEAGGWAKV